MSHVYILNKTLDSSPVGPLPVRSLYSLCASLEYSDTQEIDNITYRIETVKADKVIDANVDTIFNNVSSDQDKFLLLKANSINISKTLTPPYPKKSFIIMCPIITGAGTISMTGKGPNVLPEDILLFESGEVSEVGRVLIPAYADNKQTATISSWVNGVKGVDGTGYNCGSGGTGTAIINSGSLKVYHETGSGYSYGGGAGSGGNSCDNTSSIVDSTYPMRAGEPHLKHYYSAYYGVGHGAGEALTGSYADSSPLQQNTGVGGRLLIFTNRCDILNIEAKGVDSITISLGSNSAAGGGASGGGSIALFYTDSYLSNPNVNGGVCTNTSVGGNMYAGSGGNGTVVIQKCSKLKV